MNFKSLLQALVPRLRERPVFFSVVGVAVVLAVAAGLKASRPAPQNSTYYEVKRGDFLISIVEGGTLEAVREVIVRSEVEGTARIIFIVPEGSYVQKSNLLVELDSSASQDAVNQQQINVEKAEFAVTQAEHQLAIQKSVVESEIDAAALKVKFAELDLEKFAQGEKDQLIRNAEIEITNVLESLEIAKDRLKWTEELEKQGYETKSNLDKDRLTVSQTTLKLEQARKELWMLLTFDVPKQKEQLEANLKAAKDDLERVKLQGERKKEQYEADLQTQKSTLELSKIKLERDKRQLAATKIYAPQDGLVVYAGGGGGGRGGPFSSESMIEEGATIRNRQEIIKLPDIAEMKLLVKIHESHINNVRLGQPAFVVLDAMPDQRFRGLVNRVAPLPDSASRWANPNLKVYATEILVTDKLPNVKPGVSARAEVVITNLENVLTVPIQAVTTRRGKQVVFLANASQRPVPVSVGMYNIKFIEVTSGLNTGDRVLLSPPFDTDEKDLGGAILAEGEKPPTGDTNRPVLTTMRPDEPNGGNGFGPGQNGGRPARVEASGPDSGFGPGFRPDGESRSGRERRRDRAQDEIGGTETAGREGGMRGPGIGPPDGQGGQRGPAGFNREEFMKQFDKNGDGELDETERAAMRERFGRDRRGGRGPSTNAIPESTSFRPDAQR